MRKGFTLVELLVVIAVLSLLGVLVLTIFTSSLRGSNKSQILLAIKQNGQSVLETMDKTIRNADNVVCPSIIPPATSAPSNNLVVVTKGIYTRYRMVSPRISGAPRNECMAPTDTDLSKPTNGCVVQDNPVKQTDPDTQKEETDPKFVLRVCGPADPMPSPVTLTDTKPNTGVSIECVEGNCNTNPIFLRNRSFGFKDQVTIKFIVKPGVQAPAVVTGQIDPVTFQTTIQLR